MQSVKRVKTVGEVAVSVMGTLLPGMWVEVGTE